MSPRAQRFSDEHYVYWHYDAADRLIYVGMTVDPKRRPFDKKGRAFLAESVRCVISPPMTREAAAIVEQQAILSAHPTYNQVVTGDWVAEQDWRVKRYVDEEGCSREDAKYMARYSPKDPLEFEAFLARRLACAREQVEPDAGLEALLGGAS